MVVAMIALVPGVEVVQPAQGSVLATLLPWLMALNLVVTLVVLFVMRVFAAGRWTEHQRQVSEDLLRLTDRSEDATGRILKIETTVARHDERIKNLERGGAGRKLMD